MRKISLMRRMTAAPFKFRTFSEKQRMLLNWWHKDKKYHDMDGIIADGAITVTAAADGLRGRITWLIPTAQKNSMEPILVELGAGGHTDEFKPHEGEEFGYVLSGTVTLVDGESKYRVPRGGSFYLKPKGVHYLWNHTKQPAKVLWVSTPPSF